MGGFTCGDLVSLVTVITSDEDTFSMQIQNRPGLPGVDIKWRRISVFLITLKFTLSHAKIPWRLMFVCFHYGWLAAVLCSTYPLLPTFSSFLWSFINPPMSQFSLILSSLLQCLVEGTRWLRTASAQQDCSTFQFRWNSCAP